MKFCCGKGKFTKHLLEPQPFLIFANFVNIIFKTPPSRADLGFSRGGGGGSVGFSKKKFFLGRPN